MTGPGTGASWGAGSLAVVVVSYGSSRLLAQNLVRTSTALPGTEVVVVDSYSDDQERRAVLALCEEHDWEVVTPATNVGFGAGMNLGVGRALARGADRLLLLNPDATVDAASLALLSEEVGRRPEALLAPVVLRPDGSVWSEGTTDLYLQDGTMRATARRAAVGGKAPRVVEWLSGACLALSAELWGRVGGFDEEYFLYLEDVDLSRRVVDAGGELVVVRGARAVHDEGGTHRDRPRDDRAKSATYYYYNIRNRLLYATRHLAGDDLRRWVRTSPRAARAVVLQGGRRQLVRSPAPWLAAIRGTIDGLRLVRAGRSDSARAAATQPDLRG